MKKHKWLKRLIILFAVIILTIFFGSLVFSLSAYIFDGMAWLMKFGATALRWLAKVFDIFGFAGIFTSTTPAQAEIIAHSFKNLIRW